MIDERTQRKRRRLAQARGIQFAPVPAEPYRKVLAELLAEGFSAEALGRAAGVSGTAVRAIARGCTTTVKRPVAARLRRVDRAAVLSCASDRDLVPNIGVRRRLEALRVLGWTWADLAERGVVVGVPMTRPGSVTAATHRTIAALYDDLSWHRGPSSLGAARAKRQGCHGPDAWPDERIDDPAASPATDDRSDDALLEDIDWMLRSGVGWQEALRRLGRTGDALNRKLQRIGRNDLLHRLKANDRREAS